jgi:uncharacterized membrane protein YgcG
MKKILFAILIAASSLSFAEVAIPEKTTRIVDLTGSINQEQIAALDAKSKQIDAATKTVAVALIVPTLDGEAIESFSMRVAEKWAPGNVGVDSGSILVIAKNDKKIRIETTRNFGTVMTDAYSSQTIANMIPSIKNGDFATAVATYLDSVQKVASPTSVPDDKPASYEFIILIVALVGLGSIYFVWRYFSEKKRLEEIERERELISREYERISRERARARLSRPISENPAPIVPISPAKKAEPAKKTEPVKKAEPEPESTYVAPVFSSDDRSSSWMTSSISDISSFSSSDSSSYDGGGSSRSWGD